MKICSTKNCNTTHYAKEMCFYHYQQARRRDRAYPYMHKNRVNYVGEYAEIILEGRDKKEVGRALVDREDVSRLLAHKWYLTSQGYARTKSRIDSPMHSFIIGRKFIDHINHNRLDNRSANLRPATAAENNRHKVKSRGISKYKGVWHTKSGSFRASLSINYKTIHLGTFSSPEEAAYVYDQAVMQLFGEFAVTNFEY